MSLDNMSIICSRNLTLDVGNSMESVLNTYAEGANANVVNTDAEGANANGAPPAATSPMQKAPPPPPPTLAPPPAATP